MKTLKKLTLKDLNNFKKGVLKAKVEASDEPVFVGRILGSVRAQESVPSPYGEALKFKGTFVGYAADGEEARAVVCYLPSPVDEMLSQQINELQGDKPKLEAPVDFALDVFAVEDKGETGYKYVCKPLLETKVADPIAALLTSVPALKLAAPTAQAAIGSDKTDPPAETAETAEPAAETPAKAGKK